MTEKIIAYVRKTWPAFAVLCIGLIGTLLVRSYVISTVRAGVRANFHHAAATARDEIRQMLNRDVDLLFGMRGFVNETRGLTLTQWRRYARSLNPLQHYPGVGALAYAPKIPLRDRLHFEFLMRRMGLRGYRIFPVGPRPAYFPVSFVYSTANQTARVPGYDLFTNVQRRAAMLGAAASDAPLATPRVALMAGRTREKAHGVFVYLPVYWANRAMATPAQRHAALRGFVYVLFQPAHLLATIAGSASGRQLKFSVYDGAAGPGTLLYATPGRRPSRGVWTARIPVAGQAWTLVFKRQAGAAGRSQRLLPDLVLLGGALVSWLLFGISWLQIRSRQHAVEVGDLLRASETRYRMQVEQSPLAIQIFRSDGASAYVNQAWTKLWGLSAEDAGACNILQNPPPVYPQLAAHIREAFAGHPVALADMHYGPGDLIAGKRNRSRWVRSFLYPTKNGQGQVLEVVLMYEDISERKQSERELRDAKQLAEEANRAKDQFLAVLSHELRNPLAPVLSVVNMLQERMLDPQESQSALAIIRRNVELEARLIDDLLDVTRITRGKLTLNLETVDVHTIVQQALETCSEELTGKQIRVQLQLSAENNMALADPARLQQIFWNLIKNSVKFTPAGGQIVVRSDNPEQAPALEGPQGPVQPHGPGHAGAGANEGCDDALPRRAFLRVVVVDTGIGIDTDNLQRIFDAFDQGTRRHTQQFGGLGLGLAISKALAEAHGGMISVASEGTNRGAAFTVLLPVAAGLPLLPVKPVQFPRTAMAGRPAPANAALATVSVHLTGPLPAERRPVEAPAMGDLGPRILLVEDQDDARRAMAMLLEKIGYVVRSAATVAGAIQVAQGWEFDLLLSDIGLPDGTGLDLVKKIKAMRGVRSIALSGYGMDQDIANSRAAGFDCHLTKPVNLVQLEATIQALTQPCAAGSA